MWDTIFDFIITPIFIFIGGYIYLRIAGKKAVSQMNSFDILFVFVMGTIVAEPIVSRNVYLALLYGFVLLVMYVLFSYAAMNNKLRWLLIASPTVLIKNGDIDEKGLRKSKMTVGELLAELRKKGYTATTDVELATMEDTGHFSIIPKANARPLQPSDISLSPSPTFIPIPVVMDGQIIDHNLKYLKKGRDWLEKQMAAYSLSIEDLDKITLAVMNQKGFLDIDTTSKKQNQQGAFAYKPGRDN